MMLISASHQGTLEGMGKTTTEQICEELEIKKRKKRRKNKRKQKKASDDGDENMCRGCGRPL